MAKFCCIPDCTTALDRGHITCPFHWRSLPPRIQAEAQYRLRGWKSAGDAAALVADWWRQNRKRERVA